MNPSARPHDPPGARHRGPSDGRPGGLGRPGLRLAPAAQPGPALGQAEPRRGRWHRRGHRRQGDPDQCPPRPLRRRGLRPGPPGRRPVRGQGRRDRAGDRPGHAHPRGRDVLREAARRCPAPRGGPRPTTAVAVLGFPVGGTGLAVTRGVVSRIEYAAYNDLTEGLRIQVDAAVNPGNSGGPALVDGRMVGLVFGQLGRPRTSATSSPTRRSTPSSTTSRTAATTASRGSPTTSRRWRTRRCGRSSAWPGRTGGSWSAGRAGATRPTRSARGTSSTRIGDAAVDNEGMVDFEDEPAAAVHGPGPPAGQGRDGPGPRDPRRQAARRRACRSPARTTG